MARRKRHAKPNVTAMAANPRPKRKTKPSTTLSSATQSSTEQHPEMSKAEDDSFPVPLQANRKERTVKSKAVALPALPKVEISEDEDQAAAKSSKGKRRKRRTKSMHGDAATSEKTQRQTFMTLTDDNNEQDHEDAAQSVVDIDAELVETECVPQYKDDSNAFNTPVENSKDYFTALPPEVLQDILSYLILDNDPERAVRLYASRDKWVRVKALEASKDTDVSKGTDTSTHGIAGEQTMISGNTNVSDDTYVNKVVVVKGETFEENPHVLLSMAAMSKHFRDNVEDFARRWLVKNKDDYGFCSNEERETSLRRSERLKAMPQADTRCYRFELVSKLLQHCVVCGGYATRRSILATAVACHPLCERELFPDIINLTNAMQRYDLRDWMLIPSRKPGPRAKKFDFPRINYGTERTGTPSYNGKCISYKFSKKDVEQVARAVHKDLDAHMVEKNQKRLERKKKRRKIELRKLRTEHEKDINSCLEADDMLLNAWEDLAWPSDSDADSEDESAWEDKMTAGYIHLAFGPYSDEHRRICPVEHCANCREGKMRKYCPWYR